ncbi:MAG TPA: nucleotidyltransferase family protein [Azospirillum sp.]|nr:nucleotidyltransferase family protein [Azospirillum sp.]
MTGAADILAPLAPEFRLLCAAVRRAQGNGDVPALRAAMAAGPDWALVLRGAARHRATALVLAGLQADGAADVPPDVLAALRRAAAADTRRCLAHAAEVVRLVRLFAAADIRVLVLKGVVLSQQLYGNLAMRGPGDIDLLVDPARFWEADAVLAAAGYRLDGPAISPARRAAGQRLFRDLTYRDAGRGLVVELHQRLTANPRRLEADFDSLWRDRVDVALAGVAVATLPRRVLALYLCVHGAHHCWERLCWLADLTALLKDAEGAAAALAQAEAAGLRAAMRLVVTLGHGWLGLPLPGHRHAGRRHAGRRDDRRARRFVARFFAGSRWLDMPREGSAAWLRREAWRRLHLYSFKDDWRHGWDELRADLANPIDWGVFPLPDRLLWLYPFLRPVGWVVRNARRKRPAGRKAPPD